MGKNKDLEIRELAFKGIFSRMAYSKDYQFSECFQMIEEYLLGKWLLERRIKEFKRKAERDKYKNVLKKWEEDHKEEQAVISAQNDLLKESACQKLLADDLVKNRNMLIFTHLCEKAKMSIFHRTILLWGLLLKRFGWSRMVENDKLNVEITKNIDAFGFCIKFSVN